MKTTCALVGWVVVACVAACTKRSPSPPAAAAAGVTVSGETKVERNPEATPSMNPSAVGKESGTSPAKTPPSSSSFTVADPTFAQHVAAFPLLALPARFPLEDAAVQAAKRRPVAAAARDRFVCSSKLFDCKRSEEHTEFFRAGRVNLGDRAVALIYHGIGDMDVQQVILTYDAIGLIRGSLVMAGEFGDRDHGCDGELGEDRVAHVNRFVYRQGIDKEYVKDQSFRLTARGEVEEVVR